MEKREHCIRFIRSRIPYMGEKELNFLMGFIRGLNYGAPFSHAEYLRPVLSEAEQRNTDSAYRLMETVRGALAGGNGYTTCCILEGGEAQEHGAMVIGEHRGELPNLIPANIIVIYFA